ncbi:CDGSH iron-sulfur domain-containing protein [Virgibacillus ndiopensis]|uniref:CDGSH iron-sulfur domain-containing protein n=1 Tax=Virgibacillus ndiopensis TaxID=2004408 RepID=UPI000C07DB7D|nr:CDGSH iron-sulfur domain-containing protein [Virgibacillus ndiopensis]
MADSTIKVSDNGPYVVTGSYEVVDADGNTFKTKKAVSLCRCGHSSNKPFCDGTHKEIDFDSAPRADMS